MTKSTREKLKLVAGKGKRVTTPKEPVTSIVPSKKKVDSGAKGSTYERRIAKLFSQWAGELIRRTPMSGGWAGSKAFDVAGDLVSNNPAFTLHIEAKKHERWRLEDLLTGARKEGSTSLIAWWEQATRECPESKSPLLVFSRNLLPDLVMLYEEDMFLLTENQDINKCINFIWAGLRHGNGSVLILTLDEFFKQARPPEGCKNHSTWKRGNRVQSL